MKKTFMFFCLSGLMVTIFAGIPYIVKPTVDGTGDDSPAVLGAGDDVNIEWNTDQTNESMIITVGTDSRNMLIVENGDENDDRGIAQSTDPHLVIQSASATDNDNFQIYHDQSNANIDLDSGYLLVNHSDGNGSFWHTEYISAKEFYDYSGDATPAFGNGFYRYQMEVNEYIYFGFNMENSWDTNSDVWITVIVLLNGNETSGDDIEMAVICYYKGDHESALKNSGSHFVTHDIGAVAVAATQPI